MRRLTAPAVLAAGLTLATACSGGDKVAAPTSTSSTTAPAATPEPEAPAPTGLAPLTGVAGAPPELLGRPALVVKIDNAPKGRPQAGINQADLVVSEKVEDGITRLFTVFHSADADPVGPVRSARSTDIALAGPMNRPLFAYSGTNAAFQALIDKAPLHDIGHNKASGEYSRRAGRPAPYNLFSATPGLFGKAAADAGPPPPLFRYEAAPTGGEAVGGVHVEYKGANLTTVVDYSWDGGDGTWKRTQNGTAHLDAAGAQVAPRNVVVQFVDYVDTGQRDTAGTVVPEAALVGEGEAWVLTGGTIRRGRWSKAAEEAVTAYSDGAGTPLALAPGQTWIELAPPGAGALG